MEEIERLEKLLKDIKSCRNNEADFDYLHTMLLAEYERNKNKKGNYWNNIRQTLEKQVRDYEAALMKSNSALSEYNSIIMHFDADVAMELGQLRLNNPSGSTTVE